MDRGQGAAQIVAELVEGPAGGRSGSADQYIVPARPGMGRQDRLGGGAQAPLRPVAGNGVADLLGTGKADAGAIPGRLVRRALARVDGMRLADRPIDTLSQGERARVMMARALATWVCCFLR